MTVIDLIYLFSHTRHWETPSLLNLMIIFIFGKISVLFNKKNTKKKSV